MRETRELNFKTELNFIEKIAKKILDKKIAEEKEIIDFNVPEKKSTQIDWQIENYYNKRIISEASILLNIAKINGNKTQELHARNILDLQSFVNKNFVELINMQVEKDMKAIKEASKNE
ncbi:MAG: hypothetical protein RR523_16325 [Cetobacterium sp.]